MNEPLITGNLQQKLLLAMQFINYAVCTVDPTDPQRNAKATLAIVREQVEEVLGEAWKSGTACKAWCDATDLCGLPAVDGYCEKHEGQRNGD